MFKNNGEKMKKTNDLPRKPNSTKNLADDFDGIIRLPSGFTINVINLYGESKVQKKDLEENAPLIQKAVAGMKYLRQTGKLLASNEETEKILFTQAPYIKKNNPNTPETLRHIENICARVNSKSDIIISMGIGGSYLGSKVIFDVHAGEFWNLSAKRRTKRPKFFFSGNNLDPVDLSELISYIEEEQEQKKELNITILVISKSGSTLDTTASFLSLYEKLKSMTHLTLETIIITEEKTPTPLNTLAQAYGFETINTPKEIGGRFCVFTVPGFLTASLIGFSIKDFLKGVKDMEEATRSENIYQNPALLNATLKHIASEKYGKNIEVFMPYRKSLKSLAAWYVQLLSESLGKGKTRDGKLKPSGRTPICAIGTSDMHSQTQQHQEGKLDKIIQFVGIETWEKDLTISDVFPRIKDFSYLKGISLSELMQNAQKANEQALIENNRWNLSITLPTLNAYHLGELMYFLAISVAYEGELLNVNAFDQPGVEAYKNYMKKYVTTRI